MSDLALKRVKTYTTQLKQLISAVIQADKALQTQHFESTGFFFLLGIFGKLLVYDRGTFWVSAPRTAASVLYFRIPRLIMFVLEDQFQPATVYPTFTPQDNLTKDCEVLCLNPYFYFYRLSAVIYRTHFSTSSPTCTCIPIKG